MLSLVALVSMSEYLAVASTAIFFIVAELVGLSTSTMVHPSGASSLSLLILSPAISRYMFCMVRLLRSLFISSFMTLVSSQVRKQSIFCLIL